MDVFDALNHYKRQGIPLMLVTVVDKSGEGPLEVGKKMIVTDRGDLVGTVGGGAIEHAAIELCKTLLKTQESRLEKYLLKEGKLMDDTTTLPMTCGGVATLYYDYVGVKAYVTIIGAGHVGQALTKVLEPLNFHLTIVDEREDIIQRFEGGNQVVCQSYVEFVENNPFRENSYVIVCTPSHQYDYSVLHKVLAMGQHPKYIGMICSKGKLKAFLKMTYEIFGKEVDLSNFYAPIGLDTGGGSPHEIAISIAAEMLAIAYNKEHHNHMRDIRLT